MKYLLLSLLLFGAACSPVSRPQSVPASDQQSSRPPQQKGNAVEFGAVKARSIEAGRVTVRGGRWTIEILGKGEDVGLSISDGQRQKYISAATLMKLAK